MAIRGRKIDRKVGFLAGLLPVLVSPLLAAAEPAERPEWGTFFKDAGVEGTIVIADERAGEKPVWVFNVERARKRFSPASTFKIPHSLFALDAGVIRDEFQVFKWDGKKRDIEAWNQDQTLRQAMRNSTVWVYQEIAGQIGIPRETEYLRRAGYGNQDASGGTEGFWLDGNLAISAEEQVEFLRKLYQNKLPFRVEDQRLVKDVMIVEARKDYILRAKTGWEGKFGWWVGWVEWKEGPVFFALNIDTPRRMEDLPKREGITRGILRSLKALPEP